MNHNILSLLGLALRGGRLAVGEEPTALAAKTGQARLLLLASDAAGNTLRRAEHLAQEGHCLWLVTPFSKAELGSALGRGSAAIAALTDTGLAAAVTERLAALDPERYGKDAARMELKLRRAKERQSVPRRDPPKKAPSSQRKDRRPPKARREYGTKDRSKDRPPAPKDGRKPAARQDRRHDGEKKRRPTGKGRPYGSRPDESRPHSGKPSRPYNGKPAGDRLRGKPQNRFSQRKGKDGSSPRSGGGGSGRSRGQ